MKVNCLECAETFEFQTLVETLEGVDVVYAECPSCNKRYLSFVVDNEIKAGFDKTKHLLQRSQNKKLSYAKRKKAERRHQKQVAENRRLMDQKKAEYQHLIYRVLHGNDNESKSKKR